jgi:hypothetical protein
MDVAKQVIPAAPVTGTVGGAAFVPEALVEGDYLVFQTLRPDGPAERGIWLKMRQDPVAQKIEDRKLTITPQTPAGPDTPEVMIELPGKPLVLFPSGYALTLELGSRRNGTVTGKIYLSIPDEQKTFLAGTFTAAHPRQAIEKPGAEDVPYVEGSIVVRGGKEEQKLRAGYAAKPNDELYAFGSAEIQLGDKSNILRWTRVDHDKPHVTMLIAGDEKGKPSHYEHSRLTPGRYLFFASLRTDGQEESKWVAWKWVTVPPGGKITADLTLDPAQTGGLEVTAPAEASHGVQLVPQDEESKSGMDAKLSASIPLQLGLEQKIVARKAVFKNLAPGKYEVRAGGQSRVVEVAVGKTAELDFDRFKGPAVPPKPEPKPEAKP